MEVWKLSVQKYDFSKSTSVCPKVLRLELWQIYTAVMASLQLAASLSGTEIVHEFFLKNLTWRKGWTIAKSRQKMKTKHWVSSDFFLKKSLQWIKTILWKITMWWSHPGIWPQVKKIKQKPCQNKTRAPSKSAKCLFFCCFSQLKDRRSAVSVSSSCISIVFLTLTQQKKKINGEKVTGQKAMTVLSLDVFVEATRRRRWCSCHQTEQNRTFCLSSTWVSTDQGQILSRGTRSFINPAI